MYFANWRKKIVVSAGSGNEPGKLEVVGVRRGSPKGFRMGE